MNYVTRRLTELEAEQLRALCKLEDGLTDWEVDFIESIGATVTERQAEKLAQIYDERIGEDIEITPTITCPECGQQTDQVRATRCPSCGYSQGATTR